MAIDYETLLTELQRKDAQGVEIYAYAKLIAPSEEPGDGNGDHEAPAALLNSLTGPGAATVTLASITRDKALTALVPLILALPTKDATTQAVWGQLLDSIRAADQIDLTSPNVSQMLQAAVAGGLLTAGEVTAVSSRTGSRAEALFGAGTVVTHTDIAIALALRGDA